MPRKNAQLAVPQTYAALKRAVLAVVLQGRRDIDRAWLLTYHETGRLIHEHLLLKKERANYGAQVFARLATDTGTSSRSLHEFVQFYRNFPNVRELAQLSWNHYRLLSQVPAPQDRQKLLASAVKQGWTSPELERRIRALALPRPDATEFARNVTPPKPLVPRRGTPGVCKVIAVETALVVDLGFATYRDLPGESAFKAGSLVKIDAAGRLNATDATKVDLFTYRAEILKVVDGDTLWVKVYLEPGRWVKQKLRLRDLDCPEMDTPEGQAAKTGVESLVARASSVTICTTKPDKYDRYLADVFLNGPDGEVYLNNELLANGHAVRKDGGYTPADWE